MHVHLYFFFFFSSRRRHTRFDCDWSSDVCSSDLSHESHRDLRCRAGLDRRRGEGGRTRGARVHAGRWRGSESRAAPHAADPRLGQRRSEEHTSELQSQSNLVCRLLLEKKKKTEKKTI